MKILFIFFCALVSFSAFSQFSFEGLVIDENYELIPFATVVLEKDSIVFEATTTFDGDFKIDSIPKGTYFFSVDYVGHYSNELVNYDIFNNVIDTIQLFRLPLKVEDVNFSRNYTYRRPIINTLPSQKIPQKVYVHSHNDYLQKYPLKTALAHQVNSIEVDVAWYKKQIKVSHLNLLIKNKPDFEELYLKPLLAKKDSLQSVQFLFVDIKSGGEEILIALNKLIAKYPGIFSTRREDNSEKIKVIVSGAINRIDLYNNHHLNYLFVDGRMNDISLNLATHVMPIVSANYASLNIDERKLLIESAHAQDKMVRFWNTSDHSKSWKILIDLEVDIIGVDDLEKMKLFLFNDNTND